MGLHVVSKARNREAKTAQEPLNLQGRLALRIPEAAQVLGICENTLRQILPELPHFHIGRSVRLPVEPLREWVRKQAEVEKSRVDEAVEDVLRSVGQ